MSPSRVFDYPFFVDLEKHHGVEISAGWTFQKAQIALSFPKFPKNYRHVLAVHLPAQPNDFGQNQGYLLFFSTLQQNQCVKPLL